MCLSQEEEDFLRWKENEKNTILSLGQRVTIYGKRMYITGGNLSGYIYLQSFNGRGLKTKVKFDPTISKTVIHYKILERMLK